MRLGTIPYIESLREKRFFQLFEFCLKEMISFKGLNAYEK